MKNSPSKEPFRFSLGQAGENWAADYLEEKGYRILDKNYRCSFGEIDLVAEKAGKIIFVEVKTRSGEAVRGHPKEAVDDRKQKQLGKVALWYLKEKNSENQAFGFDVISVLVSDKKNLKIEHLENALSFNEAYLEA